MRTFFGSLFFKCFVCQLTSSAPTWKKGPLFFALVSTLAELGGGGGGAKGQMGIYLSTCIV